jgi:hypothetical protein
VHADAQPAAAILGAQGVQTAPDGSGDGEPGFVEVAEHAVKDAPVDEETRLGLGRPG